MGGELPFEYVATPDAIMPGSPPGSPALTKMVG